MFIKTDIMARNLKHLKTFYQLSHFLPDVTKNYVRFYSNGDGLLRLIVNNDEDLKVILTMPADNDTIDKVYLIVEVENIISHITCYDEFQLTENSIIFPDGSYSLAEIEADKALFNLNKKEQSDTSFIITEKTIDEISDIFSLLSLKSKTHNSCYYFGDSLYFDFNTIQVKKHSSFTFVIPDLYSLRMAAALIFANRGKEVHYSTDSETLVLNSSTFYMETPVPPEDGGIKSYSASYFASMEPVGTIRLKKEFAYFVFTVCAFDSDATLRFEKNRVYTLSRFKQFSGEFHSESFFNSFIVSVDVLSLLLSHYIKINSEEIEMQLVKIKGAKFLHCQLKQTDIIMEVV